MRYVERKAISQSRFPLLAILFQNQTYFKIKLKRLSFDSNSWRMMRTRKQGRPCFLLSLPIDLIMSILSFVNAIDLCNAALTCRFFQGARLEYNDRLVMRLRVICGHSCFEVGFQGAEEPRWIPRRELLNNLRMVDVLAFNMLIHNLQVPEEKTNLLVDWKKQLKIIMNSCGSIQIEADKSNRIETGNDLDPSRRLEDCASLEDDDDEDGEEDEEEDKENGCKRMRLCDINVQPLDNCASSRQLGKGKRGDLKTKAHSFHQFDGALSGPEPVRYAVGSSGKLIGDLDPYTKDLVGINVAANLIELNCRKVSWLKLCVMHCTYKSVFKAMENEKMRRGEPSEPWCEMEEFAASNTLMRSKPGNISCLTRRMSRLQPDLVRSYRHNYNLYRLALVALQGHPFAQNDLAITWINNRPFPAGNKSEQNALEHLPFDWGVFWFKQAAARGLALSKYCLATCFAFPLDQKTKPSRPKPINFSLVYWLYSSAAKENVAEAQTNVGMIFYGDFPGNEKNEIISQSYEDAEFWWRKASSADQVDALLNLGLLLRRLGQFEESFSFLHKAAMKKCSRACFLVGRCYERGEGIPKDLGKAEQWLMRAAAAADGSEEEQQILDAIDRVRHLQD